MSAMEEALIPLIVFATPVSMFFISKYYRYREKLLSVQQPGMNLLEAAEKEKKQLEARIQNLESIVCSVDFELNQRLNRLAAAQSLPALPQRSDAGHDAARLAGGLGQPGPGQVVLSRYTIERELGRGGMGAVYLARDAQLGELVALKTISAAMAGDPLALREGIRREVQAARRVTHENVIRIHDLHEDGALMFLSMEYVAGETLWAQVRRRGPLPVSEAQEVLAQVASGVAAAHAAGVIHRDLKPHNVLLGSASSGLQVKIIDFGVAKASFLGGMTATGILLGTPEYMAPEQIRGGAIDARTDVYALGLIAYYALCGRPPFSGDTPIAVGFAQLQEEPRPPRELRADIPAYLEEVVLRAMAKDPAARFPDMGSLKRALTA